MSSKARRTALIGVDSADVALIEHWSDHGLLPAFARLRQEGTWIKLHNRGEFPSMAVWPSIYTGTHPGKTGVYCPVQIAPGKPELELVNLSTVRSPLSGYILTLWANILSFS
jgi:predicted AlkP superfamily phosphohydrolase/phosphomutase